MILNHDIFLIYFSKFNIDIDVSRTLLGIEPPASPSDEMERKYFHLSRLFTVERVFFVIFEVTLSVFSSYFKVGQQ